MGLSDIILKKDHPSQVWINLVQWFQSRFKCGRLGCTTSDGKSSNGFGQVSDTYGSSAHELIDAMCLLYSKLCTIGENTTIIYLTRHNNNIKMQARCTEINV